MSAAEPILEPTTPAPTPTPVATPAPTPTPAAPAAPATPPLQFGKPPAAPAKDVPRGTPAPHDPASETTAEWAKDALPEVKAWIKARGIEGKSQAEIASLFYNLEKFKGFTAEQVLRKPDWTDPESIAGYRKALALPEAADGYEGKKVATKFGEIDGAALRPLAYEAALSPQQFDIVQDWAAKYVEAQNQANLDQMSLDESVRMAEYRKSLGAAAPAVDAAVQRAITAFDLSEEQFNGMAMGLKGGEAELRKILTGIGEKLSEAAPPPSRQDGGFGAMTPEGARGEMNRLTNTPGFLDSMDPGKPGYNPDALPRWQKLQALASSDRS